MKLLKSFEIQLSKVGDLKRVWMTSFNLNVEFVETYILPVVLKESPPENIMDYESLQEKMLLSGIDFKFFYDTRMLVGAESKRTTVEMIGVSASRLNGFEKGALFHPKVIYIEGSNGTIIGSGSANLTVSGWARNQEVFAFKPVETRGNLKQVSDFFKPLMDSARLITIKKSFPDEESNWDFVHSFSRHKFLDYIFESELESSLSIWSPYFPKNLKLFYDKLKRYSKKDALVVHIVPDKVDGKIRTEWNEELESEVGRGIHFYENPTDADATQEMSHAKIWKTSDKLAIGSWNFTQKGSNLEDSNIEAGIVIREDSNICKVLGDRLDVTESDFLSGNALDAESLQLPDELPFNVYVRFDWEKQVYNISCVGTCTSESFTIKLPDIPKKITLDNTFFTEDPRTIVLKEHPKELLVNHIFDVYEATDGALDDYVISGVITEDKASSRPSQEYESLMDLLNDLISGAQGNNLRHCAASLASHLDIDTDVQPSTNTFSSMSYFRFFKAMKAFETKVQKIKDPKDFESEIFVRPGCLREIGLKVKGELRTDDKMQDVTDIFSWFLAQEVLRLIKLAKDLAIKKGFNVEEHRWEQFKPEEPELSLNNKNERRYLKKIIEGAGYV